MSKEADALNDAVQASLRNDGQQVDIGTLLHALKKRGWKFIGSTTCSKARLLPSQRTV